MEKKRKVIVGIDASRNRSGGAKAHLIGILSEGSPENFGISEIHVWSFKSLLDSLPDKPWLIKHNPKALEGSLFGQIFWQFFNLKTTAIKHDINIMFTTDASTFCRFSPMVVMSQDMLSYEKGIMKTFGWKMERLRLLFILYIQNRAMRTSKGVIFLTNYAKEIIQKSTGNLNNNIVIPHGVGNKFKEQIYTPKQLLMGTESIQCIYVSNTAMYKHQWNVVKAIANLRVKGFPVELILAGGGNGKSRELLNQEIEKSDPNRDFVRILEFVSPDEMPNLLANADISIFASSCENLPVTLLESMAVGLPIACSERGPMPEVLNDAGVFFDPENSESIELAVEKIIKNDSLRLSNAKRAKELALKYSWKTCSDSTWNYLIKNIN
jgi:glycosyltransferase involved in cell wall biosynthesis